MLMGGTLGLIVVVASFIFLGTLLWVAMNDDFFDDDF
jgi:hypothetical protein